MKPIKFRTVKATIKDRKDGTKVKNSGKTRADVRILADDGKERSCAVVRNAFETAGIMSATLGDSATATANNSYATSFEALRAKHMPDADIKVGERKAAAKDDRVYQEATLA